MPASANHKHTNRLIRATSPYLLQHAHNPVDWHEWNDEAIKKAKDEDKPIFLSIGYAACHWCHVMEHECFEMEEVAAALNGSFISIKVDREERPDIDEIYMAYTQALTRHGGWPMSVWLTPDGKPFHAGTYFPRPQFLQILSSIAGSWSDEREKILSGAGAAGDFFAEWTAHQPAAAGVIPRETLDRTATALARHFDRARGGFTGGGTNKFPPSMAMDLMLRVHRRTGVADLFDAVKVTLDNMARGGIYDHLGGGICRYSTDEEWLVPHFEKMLYDQAMVSAIYLDAYQVTKDPLYAFIAGDIFRYVLADLASPEGGFYSSRDADSEGLEGKFYLWTMEQVREVLGEEDAKLFCAYYDVSEKGNWFEQFGHAPPGPKNILRIKKPADVFARMNNLATEDGPRDRLESHSAEGPAFQPGAVGPAFQPVSFQRRLNAWRDKMLAARAQRVPPGLDDKILTGWNGLMIAALARGACVLSEPRFAEAGAKAADFILSKMRKDGRLLATYRKGDARLTAYLSDYAFLVEGLLNLYEATFDRKWLDAALELTETSITYYFDEKNGSFFFTAHDAEKLVARSKQPHDNAIPAGNSIQAMNLLRLAVLFDRKDLREKAESIFRATAPQVESSPASFERLLCAVDFYHDKVKEIAIIGASGAEDTSALLRTVHQRYLPNKVIVYAPDVEMESRIPLLSGKTRRGGAATAYVCAGYNCKAPVTKPEELAKQLEGKTQP